MHTRLPGLPNKSIGLTSRYSGVTMLALVGILAGLVGCGSTETTGSEPLRFAEPDPPEYGEAAPVQPSQPPEQQPKDLLLSAPPVNTADYELSSWTKEGSLTKSPGQSSITFDTPSGNITCHWGYEADDRLICFIGNRMTPPPSPPPDCDTASQSWAVDFVSLDADGARNGLCTGGLPIPLRGAVLPYGSALIAEPFGCLSEESGVTCIHLETERGFKVSKEAWWTF